MTSMASDSVSTILVSCKQTRFNIGTPNYRELDVLGLNITVTSALPAGAPAKGKGKARAEGTEILKDATLRLKPGQRYALVGRNGSGKSTLMRAIAEKLIPGIPEQTRIAILQQTRAEEEEESTTDAEDASKAGGVDDGPQKRNVLEDVVERATARLEVEQEIRALTKGVNSTDDVYAPLRALRSVKHERLQRELFLKDKDARLRSGARGWDARKVLTAFEKTVADSQKQLEEANDAISDETLKSETQDAIDMLADLQLQVEPSRLSEIEATAKKILTGLGFTEMMMAKPVASLSGGWRMRAALTVALLQESDILILDEPTNFLDLLGIMWLQRYLQTLSGEEVPDDAGDVEAGGGEVPDDGKAPTLLLVSHDRDFISVCTDLAILKDQKIEYFHGSLAAHESSSAERRAWLTKMKAAKDRQRAHIQQSIAQNVKQGKAHDDQNKLRQAKSRQKKLDDRFGMEVNAKGGRFKLNRDREGYHFSSRGEVEVPSEARGVSFVVPGPSELRFPGALIALEGVTFGYPTTAASTRGAGGGSKKVATTGPAVLEDVTLSVHAGDRIAILGLNGAGKSTLVKLLVEEERPSRGTVTTHPRLKLGYYSQHAVEALLGLARAEPALTALALLARDVTDDQSDGEKPDEGDLRGLLGGLGLPGRLASDVPVRRLSGGQLVRLALARLLRRRPHCLVLDEVTTHLDYETVAAARAVLREWEGAVVLVSHDRWFVRGVVEGERDDEERDDDDGSSDGEEDVRRRLVYRLKGGKLILLKGGVSEFEAVVERRVKKMLGQ